MVCCYVLCYFILTHTDIDECAENPCGANAQCVNLPGQYVCSCDKGFKASAATGNCEGRLVYRYTYVYCKTKGDV